MADGGSPSGLSAMEVGQQAVQGIKKVANPFIQGAKAQITGNTQASMPGSMPSHPTAEPPSELSPKQAGGFDLGSMLDEKNPFASSPQNPATSNQTVQMQQNAQNAEKSKVEDNQKIENLRKQLHSIYYEEFIKKAEGKDKSEEEPVADKLEREKQENEQKEMKELDKKKKNEETPLAFKKRSTGELGKAKG